MRMSFTGTSARALISCSARNAGRCSWNFRSKYSGHSSVGITAWPSAETIVTFFMAAPPDAVTVRTRYARPSAAFNDESRCLLAVTGGESYGI